MSGHVAVIGGGFSGSMTAVQLVRRGAAAVTLIERSGKAGPGLAFGAADPIHLLNVRAGSMSAFPDQPSHFADYAARSGWGGGAAGFAPRCLYAAYIKDQLAEAARKGRLRILEGEAVAAVRNAGAWEVKLGDGRIVTADDVVLALGNPPPGPPPGIEPARLPPGIFWPDPWVPGVADGLTDDDRVLIIGTGLTMVDMALLLDAKGFRGRILAISRRGLPPRAHSDPTAYAPRAEGPREQGAALLREVRRRAREIGWQQAVDELRPFTQSLWQATPHEQRRRYLRHMRPWWDVHRHRIAPQIAERIAAMRAEGRLEVAAGKLLGSEAAGGGAAVRWRRRGSDAVETFDASRIINCTGPEGLSRTGREPLLRQLAEEGTVRPAAVGIGIDVDAEARVIGADGQANPSLYAVGPLTRGIFWEINAVPDIRVQVAQVAERLTSERK